MAATLIVLGATGDLTGRYLLPGIAQLLQIGEPQGGLRLIGVDRDELDADGFRDQVAARLDRNAGQVDEPVRRGIAVSARYLQGDVTDAQTLEAAFAMGRDAFDGAAGPVILYLALPHVLFEDVIRALGQCELPEGLRVVIEKPFGEDLAGAQRLNAALARVLPEDRVFRIDHFLAKQTVLNTLGLRFGNRVFEPLWSNAHISSVDIIFDETVDAQDRAAYYDRSGALRDMVQNHLLQLLSLIAMEPPLSVAPADLSRRKVDVLRAVRHMTADDVGNDTLRGRYTAGQVNGRGGVRDVAAYADAQGVDPDRGTETYVEVILHLDNWRWAGVPFRLRTGKALARDRREVLIRFRELPHEIFPGGTGQRNELRLHLDPDRMSLQVNINGLGDPFDLETVDMQIELPRQTPSPYGQLLLAIVEGDTRLSARGEEAEEAWRIAEAILSAWDAGASPLREYAAGSDGPG